MEGKEEGWREEKDKKIRRKWTRLEQQCLFHPSFTCTSLTTGSTLSNLLARLFARFFITRPAAPSSNAPTLYPATIPPLLDPLFFLHRYTGRQEVSSRDVPFPFVPSFCYSTCFFLTRHTCLFLSFLFFPLLLFRSPFFTDLFFVVFVSSSFSSSSSSPSSCSSLASFSRPR